MRRTLDVIAEEIEQNWAKVSIHARPYLDAMFTLHEITDQYYADSARSVVAYFLSNAAGWRGEVARRLKTELNQLLKAVPNATTTE